MEKTKMKILFDINHLVDINYFKNSISYFKKNGHQVIVIFRSRGRLESILRYELHNIIIKGFGKHRKRFVSKVFFQLLRDFHVYWFIKKNDIDVVACFGPTSAIAAKMSGTPYLAFDDDFEYKIPFYHANWFSTKHIYPDYIKFSNSRTSKYHGFKELAYLHPEYLTVSEKALDEYNVLPEKYVFIREIANVSLNYKERTSLIDSLIKIIRNKDLKIILSLEDKNLESKYNSYCIILKEPVKDLYSLMYYSNFAVSSGDTVAREAAILGTPTIYTGGREMAVNDSLISLGAMFKIVDISNIEKLINEFNPETKVNQRVRIHNLIKMEWENTTSVIINQIMDCE